MTERIDAAGRWILSRDEVCRFCGTPAKEIHPAGVVPGLWTCTRCGRRQHEGTSTANPDLRIDLRINDARGEAM
jgi:ribosomal protein L37AE/L43A